MIPYEAVSYTWGPNVMDDIIIIDGRTLPVTLNLSLILRDLRSPETDRVLWIDAVCIDQSNNVERGRQVQQMKHIYSCADRVLFCISRPTEMTDLLMTSLEELQSQSAYNEWGSGNKNWHLAWKKVQAKMEQEHFSLRPRQKQGLEYILGQPWFHRVWILQEVANARDALVYCGNKFVSASIFAVSPRLVGVEPQPHCKAVLDLIPGPSREHPDRIQGQDLYSLLREFSNAEATDEYDRIYALLGMCKDTKSGMALVADYTKPVKDVIRDTILHICEISFDLDVQYNSIHNFLADLESLDNTVLMQLLKASDTTNALSLLRRRGDYVVVNISMIKLAANDETRGKDLMELLLQLRCTKTLLSARDRSGWTPLWWAVANGHEAVIQMLLEKGADIEAKDRNRRTPLWWAIEKGHVSAVQLLLDSGADVEAKDLQSRTPIWWAAENGRMEILQLLLRSGANIEARGVDDQTSLWWATDNGNIAALELLIDCGADVEAKDTHDRELIWWAAMKGHAAVVQLLLDYTSKTKGDGTALENLLWRATKEGRSATMRLLLDKGANIELKDATRRTPLSWAAGSGHEAAVQLLLDKNANHSMGDSSNQTPLSWAARNGHPAVVRLLLAKGVWIDVTDSSGQTPLSLAAEHGHGTVVRLLLSEGAAIEPDSATNPWTPLFWAACEGHEDIVKLLLEHGADRQARGDVTRGGITESPLSIARSRGHEGICKLLQERAV